MAFLATTVKWLFTEIIGLLSNFKTQQFFLQKNYFCCIRLLLRQVDVTILKQQYACAKVCIVNIMCSFLNGKNPNWIVHALFRWSVIGCKKKEGWKKS